MLILQVWLVQALLPSAVAFYFVWDSLGRKDGIAVRLRWWGYGLGILITIVIALALRYGALLVFGGKAIVNPTNEGALLVSLLMPAVGALIATLVLLGVSVGALTHENPAARLPPAPAAILGAFTTGSVLLGLAVLGELSGYRAARSPAQTAIISTSPVGAARTPAPHTSAAVSAQDPSEEHLDRMFAGAVDRFFADEQNTWILRDEVRARFERHIAASFAAEPTLSYDDLLIRARTALENELGDVSPAPYSATSAQETSEEYMRRMFAEAEDRFFSDQRNTWILRDDVLVRFQEHISAVFTLEPTLNYDDLLVRARTALENELGHVSPAAPVTRPESPPTFIDPFPKRGCSYRGVMTDAEIAECRRQGLR